MYLFFLILQISNWHKQCDFHNFIIIIPYPLRTVPKFLPREISHIPRLKIVVIKCTVHVEKCMSARGDGAECPCILRPGCLRLLPHTICALSFAISPSSNTWLDGGI